MAPSFSIYADKKLIDRKRQDTLDMCRIFTEENEKLAKQKPFKKHNKIPPNKKRGKRSLQEINPALNEEDALRIETIVDKMYDDMQERGEKVNYRRGNISTFKKDTPSKMSGRRYFFAPHLLEGPPSDLGGISLSEDNLPGAGADSKIVRFKHGIIPYFIDSLYYDTQLADVIINAFDYFEKVTCIRLQRLRERPTDNESLQKVEWLYITNPTGIRQCVHSNEQAHQQGVQIVVFGYECMTVGDIAHELMHVLGFPHEHDRPDRDQYITILWDNIKPGYKKYFKLDTNTVVQNMPYDYDSVLHYPARAFTRNGQITIMTQPGIKIGQREGLSEMDIEKINTLYSAESVRRNRRYLLKTCPSVVKAKKYQYVNVTLEDIEEYYVPKVWPYGIVNYKISDATQFTQDEIENINAVIRHIEQETCIEFRHLDENEMYVERRSGTNDKVNAQNNEDSEANNNKQSEQIMNKIDKIYQTTTYKEPLGMSENEIKTDDAHAKGSEDNQFEQETDEVSRRGAKKILRQKRSVRSAVNRTQALKSIQLKSKMKKFKNKTVPISPARRHASNILNFTRSVVPGCACPKTPGVPGEAVNIEINADCFNSVNDLLHLFVHILGLGHQHNSHDRDSYLHIVWDELTDDIKEDMKEKLPPAASAGYPYDYQSVMHFPWLQIKDGRTNIMYPIWNDGWAMGHWQGLSSTDVLKLDKIYKKQCSLRKKAVQYIT